MLTITMGPERQQNAPDKSERLYKGTSIVDFPEEYVCIDVETTGLDFSDDEIIEVAALHVKGGEVLDRFVSLVRPQSSHAVLSYGVIHELGYESFTDVPHDVFANYGKEHLVSDGIVQLTGITNEMLLEAPTEDVVMPQFFNFVGDHILVGHNANFDINFLYDACQRCGLTLHNHFVDTMRIARKLLPEMKRRRLSDVAKRLGIARAEAHRAEADVITTIACYDALKAVVLENGSISEFVNGFIDSAKVTSAPSVRKMQARKQFRTTELIRAAGADPSHPLYGKSVVFTGDLHMPRADAAQMATDAGAVVKTKVSGKTDFLVVGQQDITLVGASGQSRSEKAARELNASGKGNIQILSEQDFIRLAGSDR